MTSRHARQPDTSTTTLHLHGPLPQPTPLYSPLQPAPLIQRALRSPASLTPAEVLQLHRTLGNRAVGQLVRGHLSRQTSRPAASHAGMTVQPKLMVGPVGDQYEQEADRVAQQVVQRLDTVTQPPDGKAVPRQEDNEDLLQMQPQVQRQHGESGMALSPDLETAIRHARGGGQPLPETLRGRMEQAFGADFHDVRLHTGAQADALNRSLQARAFTTGWDIFLAQDAYRPGNSTGHELLAHELTHVVQQNGTSTQALIQRNDGQEGAGTKPRSFTKGKEYLVKYTSEREKFVYENKDALALQGILPEYYEVKPSDTTSATITQVTRNDGKTFQLEDALKREDDKYLIMIKTVGYVKPTDMKKDEKIVMDIKIGAYTKSQMQFSEEGAGFSLLLGKQIEHFFKDWSKGNRNTGYSILSGGDDYDKACLISTTEGSTDKLKRATTQIISDLTDIQSTMAKAIENITFVGSSILCVFNLTTPESSEAKMIDPDHQILTKRGDRRERNEMLKNVPKGVLTPEGIYDRERAQQHVEKMDWQLNPAQGLLDFHTPWLEPNKLEPNKDVVEQQAKSQTEGFLSKYKANYTKGLEELIEFLKQRKNELETRNAKIDLETWGPIFEERQQILSGELPFR